MASNEVQVVAAAMEAASRPLAQAEGVLEAYGAAISQAALAATSGAGEGPLAGVLETLAEDAKKRATERGAECRELSQGVLKTHAAFQENDAAGAAGFRPPSFGGVTG